MRSGGNNSFSSGISFETRCEAMLLGKLGQELAQVYRDTLQAPLPSALTALIGRLEVALEQGGEGYRRPPMARERFPS